MCSGWCNNWVTWQHARCNNENKWIHVQIPPVLHILQLEEQRYYETPVFNYQYTRCYIAESGGSSLWQTKSSSLYNFLFICVPSLTSKRRHTKWNPAGNKTLPSISQWIRVTLSSLKWLNGFQLQDKTSFSVVTLPYRVTGEYGMGVSNERTRWFSLVCV